MVWLSLGRLPACIFKRSAAAILPPAVTASLSDFPPLSVSLPVLSYVISITMLPHDTGSKIKTIFFPPVVSPFSSSTFQHWIPDTFPPRRARTKRAFTAALWRHSGNKPVIVFLRPSEHVREEGKAWLKRACGLRRKKAPRLVQSYSRVWGSVRHPGQGSPSLLWFLGRWNASMSLKEKSSFFLLHLLRHCGKFVMFPTLVMCILRTNRVVLL